MSYTFKDFDIACRQGILANRKLVPNPAKGIKSGAIAPGKARICCEVRHLGIFI